MAIKYGRPIEARLAPVEAKRKPLLELAKRPRRNRKAEWARRLVREHALTAHDLICGGPRAPPSSPFRASRFFPIPTRNGATRTEARRSIRTIWCVVQ